MNATPGQADPRPRTEPVDHGQRRPQRHRGDAVEPGQREPAAGLLGQEVPRRVGARGGQDEGEREAVYDTDSSSRSFRRGSPRSGNGTSMICLSFGTTVFSNTRVASARTRGRSSEWRDGSGRAS